MGDLTCAIILGSINLGYFSGTAQDGLVYIPREGPPTLMIKKSLPYLRNDLDIPAGARIGLELDILPYGNYHRPAASLGEDVRLSDISEKIRQIRSVKSDFEIGLIRRSAENLDAAIACVTDHLMEGMREIDLAAEVEKSLRPSGKGSI